MQDNMYLIWSQLLIIFFGALFYLSKEGYSVIKSQTVSAKNKDNVKKFTALFNFEQYFRTFLTVFSYTVIMLILFTIVIGYISNNAFANINFNIIAYIHIILSIIISIYITSRGILRVTESGISVTGILSKKVFLFRDIDVIKRVYIEDEIGVLEILLKNRKIYRINLGSYKKTKELVEFIECLFEDVKETISGEYIYKEEDKNKKTEIKNTINFLMLIAIVALNLVVILLPGPNFNLGAILLLLDLLFASNYRAHDIILKNGMIRYKLWLGSKYKSIKIEDIKNIYLRDIPVNKKSKRIVSLVIYTNDEKTEEIPIFFAYKKRYGNLVKLLSK